MRTLGTFVASSLPPFAFGMALLVVGLRPAVATPNYGLDNQLYVQATMSPNQQTFFNDTGWIASSSPLTQSFTADAKYTDPGYGSGEAYAAASATVFYGSLQAWGDGFSSPVIGREGADARVFPVIGFYPLVAYRDQLAVKSDTLPVGTPVTLSFWFSFDGTSSFVDEPQGNPNWTGDSSASVAAEFTLGDEMAGEGFDRHIGNPGRYLETATVAVGDILDITGALLAQGDAASFDAAGYSSFSFSDPTTEFIDVDTADAFLTSASGHDYSSPRVIGVPEPGTLGLFGFGAAFIGLCLIRRRKAEA